MTLAPVVAGVRRVEHHMGTVISLHAHDAPDTAVERFFDEIRALEALMSRFDDDSEVLRIERGELTFDDASPQVREVIGRCEDLRSSTGGAFDHRPIIDGERYLDPNGFAKGWIVEQALVHLQLAGVSSYFVNAGGDVVRTEDARGGKTEMAYDQAGRLTSVTDAGLNVLKLTLGPGGEPTSQKLTEIVDGGETATAETTFTYDALGRKLTMVVTKEMEDLGPQGASKMEPAARGTTQMLMTHGPGLEEYFPHPPIPPSPHTTAATATTSS